MDRRALFFLGAAVVCAALIAATPEDLRWVPTAMSIAYVVLALWSTLAAGGILAVDLVFRIWIREWPPSWSLAVAAAMFALVDWAESCQNFTLAARGASPARRAFLDSIYWTRALCVVLFVFGTLGGMTSLAFRGSEASTWTEVLEKSWELMRYFGVIAAGAGLGVGLGVVFNHLYSGSNSPRSSVVIYAAVITPLVIVAMIPLGIISVFEVWRITAPALGLESATPSPSRCAVGGSESGTRGCGSTATASSSSPRATAVSTCSVRRARRSGSRALRSTRSTCPHGCTHERGRPRGVPGGADMRPSGYRGRVSTDEQPRDDVLEALRGIESKPLADRADDYQAFADQLRSELEHSDPSQTPT